MSWFSDAVEKITHRQEFETKIKELEMANVQLSKKVDELTQRTNDNRVAVLENDREELFRRNDELVQQLSVAREELFRRNDEMVQRLSATKDELAVQMNALVEASRQDDRISVLEKDRETLFRRYDDLLERVDSDMRSNQENAEVAVYILRKEIQQMARNRGGDKDRKTRIHFVRCLDIYNTGDMNCGPDLYFEELMDGHTCFFHSIKNINYDIIKKEDWVILGGGGMLDCSPQYQDSIRKLLDCSIHVVAWGLGHNKHHKNTIYYHDEMAPIDYSKFFLFTTRDWNFDQSRFCPCVSCMMKGLEAKYTKKRKVGVLTHHEIRITEFDFDICDNSQPIEQILRFIGESEVLITNTYHGSYWATLMGLKVIMYKAFSNRFSYLKYPLREYSGDLEKDIELAPTYPNALEECRALNIELKDELLHSMDGQDR